MSLGMDVPAGMRNLRRGAPVRVIETYGAVPADPKHGRKLVVKLGTEGVLESVDTDPKESRAYASFEHNGKMVSVALPVRCLAPK